MLLRADRTAFAANLRHAIKQRGMSGRDLAKVMEVSPQAVSNWLSGTVPKTRLDQLAELLDVSVEWLMTEQGTDVSGTIMIRRLEPILAATSPPTLRETVPRQLALGLPPADFADLFGDHRPDDIAGVRVPDSSMEPDLHIDDWVFTDLTTRSCSWSGLYLCVIHDTAVWWRCVPIIKDRVIISNRHAMREVCAGDLTVIGRALRVFTRHIH